MRINIKEIKRRLRLARHVLMGQSIIYRVNFTDTIPLDYEKTENLWIVESCVLINNLFDSIDAYLSGRG